MFKVNNESPQRRSAVFIVNFEHISYLFTPFSGVSTVGFKQVNVSLELPYQCQNHVHNRKILSE